MGLLYDDGNDGNDDVIVDNDDDDDDDVAEAAQCMNFQDKTKPAP